MKTTEKKIAIRAEEMILSRQQEIPEKSEASKDTDIPICTGDTYLALNLRRSPKGYMTSVPTPTTLGELEGEYAGCDVRDGKRNIFMVKDSILYREAIIDEEGNWERVHAEICTLPSVTGECAGSPGFLIFRLADGSLFYLRHDSETDTYTALGKRPEFPDFDVVATDIFEYSTETEPLTFPSGITDLRGGIPEKVAETASKSMSEAMDNLRDMAMSDNRFHSPVYVTAGIRLWDGRILSISEPKRVDGSEWPGGERVKMALNRLADGTYTGTLAGTATLTGYRIKISFRDNRLSQWKDIIKGYEIFISEEIDWMKGGTVTVSYSEKDASLMCRYLHRPTEILENELLQADTYLAKEAGPEIKEAILRYETIHHNKPEETISGLYPPRAEKILGHGQFVHIAGEGKIATMSFGNPFVAAAVTETGESTVALAAQPVGGGAYTRQYIYLFTRGKIYALTHDISGHHCNMRQIWAEGISGRERICSAPDGVWALTDSGSLIEIRDSRVERHIASLKGFRSIACDFRRNEIWLMPGTESNGASLICHCESPRRAYMRSLSGGLPLPGNGMMALLRPDPRDSTRKIALLSSPDKTIDARGVWISREIDDYPEGRNMICYRFSKTGNSLRLTVESGNGGRKKNLSEGYLSADSARRTARIPVIFGRNFLRRDTGGMRLSVEGIIKGLESVEIERMRCMNP